MTSRRLPRRTRSMLALVSAGLLAWGVPGLSGAQDDAAESEAAQVMSKEMRLAVELFEKGDDLAAMDRFMEILVKGDPTERPTANEYLNQITRRMAIGTQLKPAKPSAGATVIEKFEPQPARRPAGEEPERREPPPASLGRKSDKPPPRSQGELSRSDRRLMKKEIEGKISARSRVLLGALRRYEDITVRMANSRLPRAIGLPPALLFEKGTRFNTDAGKVLDALADLVFSLGATQIVILPEGAVLGESKIMHMRQTMGISSHLMAAGIAPPRIRVNLLSSQVDIPRDLNNYRGILIVFIYNQPLLLSTEEEIGSRAGPPISLGVSPASFDPKREEGAIIEFSVVEPPAGLMSWRFQLLGPAQTPGENMVPLQEVKGSAPVFHQIYWNGRQKYFGSALRPGPYECILTATDMKNRTRKNRVFLKIEGAAPELSAAAVPAKPETAAKSAEDPEDAWDAPKAPEGRLVRKKPSRRRARSKRPGRSARARARARKKASREITKAPAKAPSSRPSASGEKSGATPARSEAVNYQVNFAKDTTNIAVDGENILARVADTMHFYPLDNINLVGYAYEGEADAQSLAQKRAEQVRLLLVERHAMKPDRIKINRQVVDYESFKVEIYIVAGGGQ